VHSPEAQAQSTAFTKLERWSRLQWIYRRFVFANRVIPDKKGANPDIMHNRSSNPSLNPIKM